MVGYFIQQIQLLPGNCWMLDFFCVASLTLINLGPQYWVNQLEQCILWYNVNLDVGV